MHVFKMFINTVCFIFLIELELVYPNLGYLVGPAGLLEEPECGGSDVKS